MKLENVEILERERERERESYVLENKTGLFVVPKLKMFYVKKNVSKFFRCVLFVVLRKLHVS